MNEMIYDDSDEILEENTEKSISESIELSEKGKKLVEYTKRLVNTD